MIAIYKTLSADEIHKEAIEIKPKIVKWFKNNPKKKICKAKMWYGKIAEIRKDHIDKDLDIAVLVAIENKI